MGSVSSSNRLGKELAFQFFTERFGEIQKKLAAASPSLMDAVIHNCCGGFYSADKVQQVANFFEEHPLPSSARTISQLLESMRINVQFFDRVTSFPELKDDAFWASL